MEKISEYIKKPQKIFYALAYRDFFNWIPDTWYLKLRYRMVFGKRLDLNNPRTFNEKLQWLKLYDRNSRYTTLVDKYAVREYIKEKLGEEYLIPLVGGPWIDARDIDFSRLPNQFVLKCTHDSGSVVICKDKENFDCAAAVKKLNKALKHNFYYGGREWPYKNVSPRIIAEKYMVDESEEELKDFKLMCFNSKVKASLVCSDRFSDSDGLKITFYDSEWKRLPFKRHYPSSEVDIDKPKSYEEMYDIAEKLSENLRFVRIDFYEINKKVYFGEFTFYPSSGFEEFDPPEWDERLGRWLKLQNDSGGGYLLINQGYLIWIHQQIQVLENSIGSGIQSKEITDQSIFDSRSKVMKALVDYKFFCFDGNADSVMVCTERETDKPKFYFFDRNWRLRKYNRRGKELPDDFTLPKPEYIDKMFFIAEKLSRGMPFVRIDLYCVNGFIYFGEMTFYPDSGFDTNLLPEADEYFGKILVWPQKRE